MKNLFKFSFIFVLLLIVPIFAACGEKEHTHKYVNDVCAECLDGANCYVEKDGNKTYFASLQKAVDFTPSALEKSQAPESYTKIVVMKDFSGDGVKVADYRKVEFDFAGFTYTLDGKMVGSSGTETNGFQILKDTAVIFNNGTLKQGINGARALIQNYTDIKLVDFNLDTENVQAINDCGSALSCNHGASIITGDSNIITTQDKYGIILNYGNLSKYREKGVQVTFDENYIGTVSGKIGYFNSTTLEGWTEKTVLTIKSGNFEVSTITDEQDVDENIQITGGVFNQNVGKFCLNYYECYAENNVYKVRRVDSEQVVCYVENNMLRTYYNSLNDIPGNAEGTLYFLKDYEEDSWTYLSPARGRIKTVDFGGHTYITEYFENISNVVFRNGTIENSAIRNWGSITFDNLNLVNCNIEQYYANITFTGESNLENTILDICHDPEELGQDPNAYINVSFTSDYTGVVGFTEDYSGPYTSNFNIYCRDDYDWSTINITIGNGTFKSFGRLTDCNATISGGTFYNFSSAPYTSFYYESGETDNATKITGGVFNIDVSDLCYETAVEQDSIQIEENGEMIDKTIYTVKKASVKIYDGFQYLYFFTPEEAVSIATDGDTIYCLQDIYRRGFAVEGKELTFDLNGHEYVVTTSSVFKTSKSAKVTIKNGTIKPYKQASLKTLFQVYAGITLEDVNIYGKNDTYGGNVADLISCYYGTIIIKGNSQIIASAGNNVLNMYWGLSVNYKKGMTVNVNINNDCVFSGNVVYDADSRYTTGIEWEKVTILNMNSGNFDVNFVNAQNVETMYVWAKGGTYSKDVSAYCPTGYECICVSEGVYQVSTTAA